MADGNLFDIKPENTFITDDDIQQYLNKVLYPRGTAIEKRIRFLAERCIDNLNVEQKKEKQPLFTRESLKKCDIEVLIHCMKELDHQDKLDFKVPIKDELQSYNVLKNDLYKRFKHLKEVLDEQKR